jgi:nicotinamide-nucleotide amidase
MPNETSQQLARLVGERLKASGIKMVSAESCTGGWIGMEVTAIAGSSDWYDRGFITYSNESKQQMLNVSPLTLNNHGAVSEQTVLEMARGALQNSQAQIAIAVSGIAGPAGGSADKPVGTVWLAWVYADKEIARLFHFQGDRLEIRRQAVIEGLRGLVNLLDG